MKRKYLLYGCPGGEVDDGVAVAFDGEVRKMQNPDVEFILKKSVIGVQRVVDVRLFVDLEEGASLGFHPEGDAETGYPVGIRIPTMSNVVGVVASFAKVDGCALEAARGRARDTTIFLYEVTKPTLRIEGGLFAFFFVGHVDEEFDEAAIVAFRDLVVEGVDEDAPFADDDLVELGIVDVAGEAGIVPEEETTWSLSWDLVEGEHTVEVVATGEGAA